MAAGGDASTPTSSAASKAASIDAWVHEHDAEGEAYRRTQMDAEVGDTLASAGMSLTGMVLGFLFISDLFAGILLLLSRPPLIPFWLGSLALLAVGTWLAFRSSGDVITLPTEQAS